MNQSKFFDSQIMAILKQVKNGLTVPAVCREHGIMHGHVLQMASQVWRYGCVVDRRDERAWVIRFSNVIVILASLRMSSFRGIHRQHKHSMRMH